MTDLKKLADAAECALAAYQHRFESVAPPIGRFVGPIDEEMSALRAALASVAAAQRVPEAALPGKMHFFDHEFEDGSELDLAMRAWGDGKGTKKLDAVIKRLMREYASLLLTAAPPAPAAEPADGLQEDADRWRWLVRHASLGFDGAPSWNAVVRLPVSDSDDQTITALVDRARSADQARKGG